MSESSVPNNKFLPNSVWKFEDNAQRTVIQSIAKESKNPQRWQYWSKSN